MLRARMTNRSFVIPMAPYSHAKTTPIEGQNMSYVYKGGPRSVALHQSMHRGIGPTTDHRPITAPALRNFSNGTATGKETAFTLMSACVSELVGQGETTACQIEAFRTG